MNKKDYLFRGLSVLFPFLILCAIEIFMRHMNYGSNTALFVDFDSSYYQLNQQQGRKYFPKLAQVPTPNFQLLKKEKEPGSLRIFVFGGSTTAGYPYYHNLTFPNLLRKKIETGLPDSMYIEIVNFSMAAVNLYTVIDQLEESFEYSPDFILLYSGHNEYYGADGAAGSSSFMKQPKLFYFLRKFYFFQFLEKIMTAKSIEENKTLMNRVSQEKQIPKYTDIYQEGVEQYMKNLTSIADKCQGKNVPLLIGTLVSNINDHFPFMSNPNLEYYFPEVKNLPDKVKNGDLPNVLIENIPLLLKKDSSNSALNYLYGKIIQQKGETEEADDYLNKAKEYDLIRFRASEDLNSIIQMTCQKFSNTFLVDLKKSFYGFSNNKSPGNHLFCDHLHPNIQGYYLMSESFYSVLSEKIRGIIHGHKNFVLDDYTELDSVTAEIRLSILTSNPPYTEYHSKSIFQEKNYLDTLALQIVHNEISWETGHYQLAVQFEKNKLNEKAGAEYSALYTAFPYKNDALLKAAENYLQAGLTHKVEKAIKLSLRLDNQFDALRFAGIFYLQEKKLSRAFEFFYKALKKKPNSNEIKKYLALTHYQAGNIKKSKEILNSLE